MKLFWSIGLLLVASSSVAAQGTEPGWYVETRVTTARLGRAGNTVTSSATERTWTTSSCSRSEGAPVRGDSTGVRIVRMKPVTVYEVSPRTRTTYLIDGKSADSAKARARLELTKVNAGDMRLDVKSVGDGGTILGHKTHKFQSTIMADSLTMGRNSMRRPETRWTIWEADDPQDSLAVAYRAEHPAVLAAQGFSTGRMILKSISEQHWLRDVTVTTTRDVTVWRRERVSAEKCQPPSEYKTVDAWADLARMDDARKEVEQLRGRTDAKSKARLKVLMDSMGRALGIGTRQPRSLRDDPNAAVITVPAKKP